MADAIETARQIVKTSDDCQIEGADMATLVSRIEAHVLAYAADVQRQGDLIASMDDAAMDKMQAMMGRVAEQRDTALAYADERERLLAEADAVIDAFTGAMLSGGYEVANVNATHVSQAIARHRARSSSPAQDEGKPTT